MQSDQQVDRLIAAVRRRVDARNLSAAEDAIGVSRGYLRKAQGTTRNIMLAKFLGICAQADIDPAEVFAEVFPRKEPELDFGIPIPDRPVPHIVKRVRHRLDQDQEPAAAIPRSWLEWLDELRYDKPQRALRLVEETLDYVRRADLPFALGVWASTCRLLARNEEAICACLEGLEVARKNGDRLGEIDNLQRMSFLVISMSANYRAALKLSERAGVLAMRTGDQNRIGRVLVDQGTINYYLHRFTAAEESFTSALSYLQADERRNRLTAMHTLGLVCQALGNPEQALRHCQEVAPMTANRFERGKVRWLEACALADLERWEASLGGFQEAWEDLITTSVIDAALSACDHVEALLKTGNLQAALIQSRCLRILLEPLKDNLIASAAIRDLVRCEHEEKRLNVAFLSKIRRRLQESRRADARRQLHC